MHYKYKGTILRDSSQNEAGHDAKKGDYVLVRLEDGTEKVVLRSEVDPKEPVAPPVPPATPSVPHSTPPVVNE